MAQDINSVTLVGRLTRDAELKYTQSGQAVASFGLAVNERRKNGDAWEEQANFFDINYWGKPAEAVNQYLTKGKQVAVSGRLRQDRWNDKETGQPRSKVQIVANSVELLSSGNPGGQRGSGGSDAPRAHADASAPSANAGSAYRRPAPAAQSAPAAGSAENYDDGFTDDIPF